MSTDLRPIAARIAAEVRAEIARQGLTQQQLGDRLDVPQWWVSRRIADQQRKRPVDISAAELVVIADALNVPVQSLIAPAVQMVAEREEVAA